MGGACTEVSQWAEFAADMPVGGACARCVSGWSLC